jgi:drug/metabolite transporter (DMT)-like permease
VSAATDHAHEEWRALAAAGVTVLLWASAFVGIRAAGRELSPGPLALGRLLVAALLLGGFALYRREPLPRGRDLPLLCVCGVLWFALYNVALNAGERRVDAGTAAMLVNVGPILIAILAGALLREGFPPMLFLGCAIAFLGVLVIGFATSRRGVASREGVVLCLLAAVAYASGVVAQKVVLRRVSATQTVFWCAVVGVVACLPFVGQLVDETRHASGGVMAWALYLGAGPSALGFTTWAYALARTSAGRLGATTYLVPPVSVLLGWAILGETPPALALAGGVLCLLGVAVGRRRTLRFRAASVS